MNSEGNITFIVIVILMVYWLTPTSSDSDIKEKTIYYTYCSDFKHNPLSCPRNAQVQTGKQSFKTFPKEQVVISNNAWVSRLDSCEVFDENNWRCGNINYSQSMREGDYWESSYAKGSLDEKNEDSAIPMYQQIPRLVYYIRNVINLFR